ncbi:MAG: PLP-dependent aminotransferase family protein [Clostridia bacterium]|nr:PLP-dependent aminotransferase family protein [Clostridia bacterium]
MEFVFSENTKDLKPSAIREIFKSLTDPSVISFAAGNPSPQSFPVQYFRRFTDDVLKTNADAALQYGITEGFTPLRDDVLKRNRRIFGIGEEYDTAIITSGGQQGIDLTAKVICSRGDTVICEEPTFIGALNAFRAHGLNTVGVPMHGDSIDPDELENIIKKAERPKLLYLIPTFQNPTGRTMPLNVRKRCLEIAEKYGLIILEDNPYGELRFEGDDVPTVKSMDKDGRVVYCSSFSKILSSGMRVGYVIAHNDIATKIAVCKQVNDVHTNLLFQMVCHKFLTEFDLDAHVKHIRELYRRKSALMLKCLDEISGERIEYTRPQGGLFIWANLPGCKDHDGFVKKLVSKKLAVVPGSTFSCDVDHPAQGFRLNYSTPSDEQIIKGADILKETINESY